MKERPPIPPEILGTEKKFGGLTETEIKEAYPQIFGFCLYLTKGNVTLAQDLTQTTFEHAIQSNYEERHMAKPVTWLITIAKNAFQDYLRKSRTGSFPDRNPENTIPIHELIEIGTKEQSQLKQGGDRFDKIFEDRQYAIALIDKAKLTEEEKTILMLKEVEGKSIEELVTLTGINNNTLKVKLFRAREKLVKAAKNLDKKPLPKRK